jgi:hypothetical protein
MAERAVPYKPFDPRASSIWDRIGVIAIANIHSSEDVEHGRGYSSSVGETRGRSTWEPDMSHTCRACGCKSIYGGEPCTKCGARK